mmetsp:Transcript_13243/g.30129  ORF Transcript_13243/g.30129 Transcript_13243/m.30129 type:complete len:266 (-) Transcript_13243:223-1020(-)
MGNTCQLGCEDKPATLVTPVQVIVSHEDAKALMPGLKPGYYDDTVLPAAKKKKLELDPVGQALPGTGDFLVEFSTLGQRLGIHIRHDAREGTVKVKGVDPGSAADQWNVANPSMQVTAGALIMKINGKSAEDMGPKELLNAFKITPSISMVIRPSTTLTPDLRAASVKPPRVASLDQNAMVNLRRRGDFTPETMSPVPSHTSHGTSRGTTSRGTSRGGGSSRGRDREFRSTSRLSRLTSLTNEDTASPGSTRSELLSPELRKAAS